MTEEYREQIESEIRALKSLLADTDYNSNKLIEDLVNTMQDATPSTFLPGFTAWIKTVIAQQGEVIRKRAMWRGKINELEALLKEAVTT